MKYRIAVWASAGFFVAACWALYFAMANKDLPTKPVIFLFARLTCPIAIAGSYFPISLYWALVANVATYALVGAGVEILRRQLNQSR
jgi:hypothetical protein